MFGFTIGLGKSSRHFERNKVESRNLLTLPTIFLIKDLSIPLHSSRDDDNYYNIS